MRPCHGSGTSVERLQSSSDEPLEIAEAIVEELTDLALEPQLIDRPLAVRLAAAGFGYGAIASGSSPMARAKMVTQLAQRSVLQMDASGSPAGWRARCV